MQKNVEKLIQDAVKGYKKGSIGMLMVTTQLEEETETAAGGVKTIAGFPIKGSPRVPVNEAWICDHGRKIMGRVDLSGKGSPDKPKDNGQAGQVTGTATTPTPSTETDKQDANENAEGQSASPNASGNETGTQPAQQ